MGKILSGRSTVWAEYRMGRMQGFLILNQLVDVVRFAVTIFNKNTQIQFSLILSEDTIHSHKKTDLRKLDVVGH